MRARVRAHAKNRLAQVTSTEADELVANRWAEMVTPVVVDGG